MKNIILVLLILTMPLSAKADIYGEFIEVKCVPELGYIKIHEVTINGDKIPDLAKKNSDLLWKNYKLVDMWSLFYGPQQTECIIDGNKYIITLETTKVCSHAATPIVTIEYNGCKLLDKFWFQDKCSPRRYIEYINIHHFADFLHISGQLYIRNLDVYKRYNSYRDRDVSKEYDLNETYWFKSHEKKYDHAGDVLGLSAHPDYKEPPGIICDVSK